LRKAATGKVTSFGGFQVIPEKKRRTRELHRRLQAEGDRRTAGGTVPVYR
jgi:hypothetical protein